MAKFKKGMEVFFKGKKQIIVEIIKGEIDYKKPNKQNGVLFTGYHRKPRKYKLDNGLEVLGENLKINAVKKESDYDFSKPFFAQDLGDEWDDYCWSADDF